jgi:dienelactone hydrolase
MTAAGRVASWRTTFLVAILASVPSARAQELPAGQVVAQVKCRTDASQTYALFLPSHYSPQHKWPILYALDAGARGLLPVERFKEAAETYGYIVAGSNNSRNGPMDVIITAVRALLDDTRARFSIDDRRVYFTGFSGGARVAVFVANSLAGGAAGVIGSGAGLPPEIKPSTRLPFPYFGMAGTEDFSFPEMRHLDLAMDASGVPHRFVVFPGAHEWPPKDFCTTAIEWMELQAMRSGVLARNEQFIDELLRRTARKAVSDEASGRMYDAFLEYEALARDFKELRDVTEYQKKTGQLRNSKAFQQAVGREREEEESQNRWIARLMRLKASYADTEDLAQLLLDLNTSISDLGARADKKADSSDRRVARRVRSLFLVQLTEGARDELASRDYREAAFSLSLSVRIRPESATLFYNLACAYALGGRKGDAITALKRAIANGFSDVATLETDRDLDTLRGEAAFQAMLQGMKKVGR